MSFSIRFGETIFRPDGSSSLRGVHLPRGGTRGQGSCGGGGGTEFDPDELDRALNQLKNWGRQDPMKSNAAPPGHLLPKPPLPLDKMA